MIYWDYDEWVAERKAYLASFPDDHDWSSEEEGIKGVSRPRRVTPPTTAPPVQSPAPRAPGAPSSGHPTPPRRRSRRPRPQS